MEKFTKGEWYTDDSCGGVKLYNGRGFQCSSSVIKFDDSVLSGESWLDMMKRTEPSRREGVAEANANIYLMAAAPDMYRMLEALLNAEGVIKTYDNRKAVKNMLAKARGE